MGLLNSKIQSVLVLLLVFRTLIFETFYRFLLEWHHLVLLWFNSGLDVWKSYELIFALFTIGKLLAALKATLNDLRPQLDLEDLINYLAFVPLILIDPEGVQLQIRVSELLSHFASDVDFELIPLVYVATNQGPGVLVAEPQRLIELVHPIRLSVDRHLAQEVHLDEF